MITDNNLRQRKCCAPRGAKPRGGAELGPPATQRRRLLARPERRLRSKNRLLSGDFSCQKWEASQATFRPLPNPVKTDYNRKSPGSRPGPAPPSGQRAGDYVFILQPDIRFPPLPPEDVPLAKEASPEYPQVFHRRLHRSHAGRPAASLGMAFSLRGGVEAHSPRCVRGRDRGLPRQCPWAGREVLLSHGPGHRRAPPAGARFWSPSTRKNPKTTTAGRQSNRGWPSVGGSD